MSLLIFIFLFNVVIADGNTKYYHEDDLPGIIFIPGDGGNKLETKLVNKTSHIDGCHTNADWHLAWVNISELTYADCWAEDMTLHYNFSTHTSHNTEGVHVRAPNFGDVEPMMVLDNFAYVGYFSSIVYMLEYMGYSRDVDLIGASFDFRYAPNEMQDYFNELKKLIEKTFVETQGPVILLVHSMGAPLTNYFLNTQSEEWKNMYIHSMVSLAGAWGGSAKTIKVYAAGDDMDSPFDQLKLRIQQRSDPSLAFLLPDPDIWKNRTIATIFNANYTMNDIEAYFGALNLVPAVEIYHDVKPMLYKSKKPPRVALHCLYGTNVDTDEWIEYVSPLFFPDNPIIHKGPGDGTVNHRSLDLCSDYAELQTEPITVKSFNNVNHMQILHKQDVLEYIAKVITEEASRRSAFRKMNEILEPTAAVLQKDPIPDKEINNLLGNSRDMNRSFEFITKIEELSTRKKGSRYRRADDLDFEEIFRRNYEFLDKVAKENENEKNIYEQMKIKYNINKEMRRQINDSHKRHAAIEKAHNKRKEYLKNLL